LPVAATVACGGDSEQDSPPWRGDRNEPLLHAVDSEPGGCTGLLRLCGDGIVVSKIGETRLLAARGSVRTRRALIALCVLAALATALFSARTYWSAQLMRSAYAVGAPGLSNVRAWMTLCHVATVYRAPEQVLIERLGLAPETDPNATLKTIAEAKGVAPLEYVQQVQRAIAAVALPPARDRESDGAGWLDALDDRFLSALLVYGYPVLGVALLLAAIGVPLPGGLLAAVAGSLAAHGQLNWIWASIVAVTASVAGDAVGYGVGHLVSAQFLERWGRWIGYTPARRLRVSGLFERFGVLTILLSRTLVSGLSSVVNLLAGANRYRLVRFLALAVVGRFLWTSAYLGLGYIDGADLEAATRFLQNVAGVLVSLALLVGAIFALSRRHAGPPQRSPSCGPY